MPPRLFLLFCFFAGHCLALSDITSNQVRIRLFKNLNSFPQIQNAQIRKINDRLWTVKGRNLQFQKRTLSTQNLIVKTENQNFEIIGQFDFDEYLAGVIVSEMPVRWPLEALRTQAIVARSFAMARMQERKSQIFHLDSDQMDQVFQAKIDRKALIAVKETQHIVLKSPQGEILKAFFHSDCGGQTIPASKVWSGEVDTGTAIDPWCQKRASNQWSFEIAQQRFLENLKQPESSEMKVGEVFAEKIQALQINRFQFPIQKIRQIFGFSKVKNSPERAQFYDGKVVLKGRGYGHGAGLCQWGTYEQAKLGLTRFQILKHYFPLAEIALDTPQLVSR